MFSDLPHFQLFAAMARHAAESQRVTSANMARAADPGYRAMAVESFEAFMSRSAGEAGAASDTPYRIVPANPPAAPNGNTVSIEHETRQLAQAAGRHTLALNVYGKSIEMLRLAISGRR